MSVITLTYIDRQSSGTTETVNPYMIDLTYSTVSSNDVTYEEARAMGHIPPATMPNRAELNRWPHQHVRPRFKLTRRPSWTAPSRRFG